MGKSKKRILHKTNSSIFMTNEREKTLVMTRETAINRVFGILSKHAKSEKIEAHNLITLFGLDAEELSEAGVDYENLKSLELLHTPGTLAW